MVATGFNWNIELVRYDNSRSTRDSIQQTNWTYFYKQSYRSCFLQVSISIIKKFVGTPAIKQNYSSPFTMTLASFQRRDGQDRSPLQICPTTEPIDNWCWLASYEETNSLVHPLPMAKRLEHINSKIWNSQTIPMDRHFKHVGSCKKKSASISQYISPSLRIFHW